MSPLEVIEEFLSRIEQLNPALNAIVTLNERVTEQARAAESELSKSSELGPLHGVPLTIKDTIDTAGLRTTGGSRLRAKHVPLRDAAVVARLRSAGTIILGKTNVPEMAIPYETDNPVFGRTNHPLDPERTPGGSSGGEAAAIAACLSPAGIGSDLSGSIRVPAHFCGIAGLKPTPGLVPMEGHVPEAEGVLALGACVGPMARRVEDLSLLLNVIAEPARQISMDDLHGLRVGYYTYDGVTPVTEETHWAVEHAAQILRDAGLKVYEALPPSVCESSRLWIELFSAAASKQLREYYRGKEKLAGPQVVKLLKRAADTPGELEEKIDIAERRAKGILERARVREKLLQWMKATPLLLAPVGSVPAFKHGASRVDVERQSISIFRAFGYSQMANVFGLPSVSVPAHRSREGLPIGVQIIGRPFAEPTVLAAAAILEKVFASQ